MLTHEQCAWLCEMRVAAAPHLSAYTVVALSAYTMETPTADLQLHCWVLASALGVTVCGGAGV